MKKKEKEEKIHLTDHFTSQIIDNVIYLFEDTPVSDEELNVLFKKVSMIIEDEEISYINISSKNIEDRKNYYLDLGFSLSYYSVDKLNELYKGYRNKKAYRCYAVMTKKDFLKLNKKEEKKKQLDKKEIREKDSNKGFISSILLLLGALLFLCYLTVEAATVVIQLGR